MMFMRLIMNSCQNSKAAQYSRGVEAKTVDLPSGKSALLQHPTSSIGRISNRLRYTTHGAELFFVAIVLLGKCHFTKLLCLTQEM